MSDAGIQRGRDPRGKGGGGEKGLAAGGSAPPARPLRTRHCLLKGHSGIQILTRRRRELEGGRWGLRDRDSPDGRAGDSVWGWELPTLSLVQRHRDPPPKQVPPATLER